MIKVFFHIQIYITFEYFRPSLQKLVYRSKAGTANNIFYFRPEAVSYIDPFPKRHRLVYNGGFPKFEALYCSLNMVNSTEFL